MMLLGLLTLAGETSSESVSCCGAKKKQHIVDVSWHVFFVRSSFAESDQRGAIQIQTKRFFFFEFLRRFLSDDRCIFLGIESTRQTIKCHSLMRWSLHPCVELSFEPCAFCDADRNASLLGSRARSLGNAFRDGGTHSGSLPRSRNGFPRLSSVGFPPIELLVPCFR